MRLSTTSLHLLFPSFRTCWLPLTDQSLQNAFSHDPSPKDIIALFVISNWATRLPLPQDTETRRQHQELYMPLDIFGSISHTPENYLLKLPALPALSCHYGLSLPMTLPVTYLDLWQPSTLHSQPAHLSLHGLSRLW